VRVSGEPGDVVPSIERALASVDPLLPLASTRLASDLQDDGIALERFTATLVGALAAVAVVLASLGIYGLVASTVAEKRREIGIRLALGARATHAIRIAAVPSIRLAAIGAVLGIGGSIAAGRALRSMLFGVAPSDPWTYAGVTIGLVAAAAIASLIPAARAARVDPAQTLRVE
jgi:putative ABC transport system permease protein